MVTEIQDNCYLMAAAAFLVYPMIVVVCHHHEDTNAHDNDGSQALPQCKLVWLNLFVPPFQMDWHYIMKYPIGGALDDRMDKRLIRGGLS